MKKGNNFVLVSCTSSTVLFQKTTNISSTSFTSARKSSTKAKNILDCGGKCVYYEDSGQGYCNAYSFNEATEVCELASITYLEVRKS